MNYISGTKTIIFEEISPFSLNAWLPTFNDIENIIIVKLNIFNVKENDNRLDNLPITLKSLIIGKIKFTYPYQKVKRDDYFKFYCKLPFCCEAIKGKVSYIFNERQYKKYSIMRFKYINNFKDFSFECVLKPHFHISEDSLFTPYSITNKGKYYEIIIT